MDSHNIMFVVLAVLMVFSAFATVLTKSIIRAATYLFFVLLGTAGMYFLMGYTFLGAVQVMVYAGGIVVLYVFAILLTNEAKNLCLCPTFSRWLWCVYLRIYKGWIYKGQACSSR